MAGAQSAQASKFSLSALKSSTSFAIVGAAFAGGIAACAATALFGGGASALGYLIQFGSVFGAAVAAGLALSPPRSDTTATAELTSLTLSMRNLSAQLKGAQPLTVSGDGAVAHLTQSINDVVAAFENERKALEIEISEARNLRDQSESASLAKSHFLANMSHELRTPLNAIIGYAKLLHEDAVEDGAEQTADDLSRILRAARHLLSLINDILDLSKIEAGKDEVDNSLVNVRALVEETLVAVGPRTRTDSEVVFKLELPEKEIFMQTDGMKVRQCLVNLLSNAFKFTEQGHVTLRIHTRPAENGNSVVFEVEDTGIGIEESKIEKLFDAFVQADVSTTQKYGGTGLGLAITQRLSKLMGGDLRIDSVYGKGSTFTLVLPQEPVREIQTLEYAMATSEAPANNDNDDDRLALIIDDDASNVDLLTRWLKKQGYSVATAFDGEAGLEVARTYEPDLILLDIHMPRANGWDVLAELNKDDKLKNVPVVVISVDDNRKRGLDSGASEYLTKPTTQKHLADVLETFNTTTSGHILVVDDDEDAGNIIERAARLVGLEVSRAFDGETGLEMARAHKPSAIVLDLTMPRRDGFSVLHELGSDPELRGVPVIIVSARTLNGNEFSQIAESGCDFHAKGVSSPHDIAANLISVVGK